MPYRQDYVENETMSDGGMSVHFYFNEQVDGTWDIWVKGRAVYLGSSNSSPALAWYLTPLIEKPYQHAF